MSTQIPVLPRLQFLDANGDPLAGGLLYTYESGTTTPKQTFTDVAGLSPNTNPVVLDANGFATVRVETGAYTFELQDSDGVLQWSADNITSVGGLVASATGAMLIANNLSDVDDVATSVSNLGLAPLSTPTTTAITDGMSATSISGYSFTPGNWVHIEYFVTRNSGAVLGSGTIDLHYDGSAWVIVEGPYRFDGTKAFNHGLTFTMSGNQLQVAADSSGAGSLITKYHAVL